MSFEQADLKQMWTNPFLAIGEQWMLVSAGDEQVHNTMTASWGGMGVLWGEPTVTVYLRPQRYTRELIEANDLFTVSFLDNEPYAEALRYCGRVSGRDVDDKFAGAGLMPLFVDGTCAVAQAELVLVCRKIYAADMPPENFIDPDADAKWYPDHDYHRMYIGRIEKFYVSSTMQQTEPQAFPRPLSI